MKKVKKSSFGNGKIRKKRKNSRFCRLREKKVLAFHDWPAFFRNSQLRTTNKRTTAKLSKEIRLVDQPQRARFA